MTRDGAAEGRVPPYSQESEVAVLGSIMMSNGIIPVVRTIIEPEDFYLESHRRIFNAMCDLSDNGGVVDPVTLGVRLRERGDLEKIGGAIALSGLTDAVATPSNFGHYATIVHEKAAIRRVIYKAQEVAAHGFNDRGVEEVERSMDGLLNAAAALARTRMPARLTDMGGGVVELYRKVAGGYRGIELPWPTVSNMTAGLWPKTVTIFVARPGVGKTFVAVIAARFAWICGKRVLIISPEMSKEEIAERFFVVEAGVSYANVMRGELSDFELPRLTATVDRLRGEDGLWIMDSDDDLSPKGMEAAIRACKPHLVAVDSIYDIKVKGERRDRVLTALDWMKKSAREMGYASVGFAQQNRVAELSEKKGGGARLGTIALADEIGQDSHAVFALEQTKDMRADKTMRIKRLKLRRGTAIRDVLVNWDFDKMKFDEIDENDGEFDDQDDVPF
jgi:replicative DNA helicase